MHKRELIQLVGHLPSGGYFLGQQWEGNENRTICLLQPPHRLGGGWGWWPMAPTAEGKGLEREGGGREVFLEDGAERDLSVYF